MADVMSEIAEKMSELAGPDQLVKVIPFLALTAATKIKEAEAGKALKVRSLKLERGKKKLKEGVRALRGMEVQVKKNHMHRRKGAAITNAQHEEARVAVYDWLGKHYDEYKRKKATHGTMAEEIERHVARDYGTILKDITAWKKIRKR